MLLSLTLLGIIFLCLTLIWYSHLTKHNRLIAKIPGPKTWPIVGNSLCYMLPPEELFSFLRSLFRTYNGINQAHGVNKRVINIYDPEDIKTILSSTRFNSKQIPYNFLKPWLCEGLLISNGAKWQQRRKLLTKAFHFNILMKYMQTITEQAEIFLDRVAKEEAEEGKTTDIMSLVSEITLQIICMTTMGNFGTKKTQTLSRKYLKAIHEFGQIFTKRLCTVWFYFDFIFMFSTWSRVQKQITSALHEFTVSIINYRKEQLKDTDFIRRIVDPSKEDDVYSGKGGLAMLDLLLQYEEEGMIDLDGIREEVDTFIFEGHDTTASAITFFMMRIANEPTAQNKIYEEMQSIFRNSTRSATINDLNEMKYLECCIKESLRLYPIVPYIARYLTEEISLSGYRVPSGTICQLQIFDAHRSDKIYPNPEEFVPERFLPENSALRHPYAFIPFSAGPRNCIGQKFAMLELKILISGLLRRFRLEPITKPQDLIFRADLVLRTSNPIYVQFCARK